MLYYYHMDLEELKKKLYKRDQKFEGEPKAPEIFEPGHKPKRELPKKEPQAPKPPRKNLFLQLKFIFRRYFFVGVILALLCVLIVGGIIYWLSRQSFDKALVAFKIEGPERVISGEDITFRVTLKNNSKTSLTKLRLIFSLPEGSVLEEGESVKTVSLADLKSGGEKQEEFNGKIIGLRNERKTVQARLIYLPKNISSEFENEASFQTLIVDVPLALNLDFPARLSSGQTLSLTIQYLNDSAIDFSDLELKIDYPPNFSFISAHPSPNQESNIWQIDNLASNAEGKILISGNITGQEGEIKSFRAYLGKTQEGRFIPLVQVIKSSQISAPPLSIWQKVNGSDSYIARQGEALHFQINYKNTTDEVIKGIIITSKMEGKAFDFASVKVKGGSFESTTNTVVWNEATLPALSFLNPGQEGEITFSIEVKDKIPISSYQDKNFVLINTATIDSPYVPLSLFGIKISGESKLEVKLKTDLILNMRGYYFDETFSNYGPLPPKVGQTTTYTVFWEALNYFNDVREAKVETSLLLHIKWLEKFEPQNADVRYDPISGKLTWLLGDLPAGTGVLLPVKSLAFQIALVPSLTQVGQAVELIKESFISGQDTFVVQDLKEGVAPLTSVLPDDPGVGWQKARVRE